LLDVRQVAFYSIAVGVATLLWHLPNTVGIVLFPELSSIQNEKKIHVISTMVCRNTLMIAFLGAIFLSIAGKFLIQFIYGTEYIHSVNAMLLILPGVVIMCIYKVLTRNFSSRNRQQVAIMAAAMSLIVNIGLNLILIPRYGIEGAAIASTVSYFLAGAILVFAVNRESDISVSKMLFINRTDMMSFLGIASRLVNRKKYQGI
jgi:O-antigen/teichoic acid export membrane protein